MKRFLIAGVVALTVMTLNVGNASAQSQVVDIKETSFGQLFDYQGWLQPSFQKTETVQKLQVAEIQPVEEKKPEPPKPIEYVVVSGDNLTKIAEAHNVTWVRIWQKNLNIANQDVINVGDKLIIPFADEVLADRPLVAPPVQQSAVRTAQNGSVARSAYDNGGNTYDYGYCTWYVKNRRPDLPNGLGNANTWYARAQSYGLATGTTPRAGAVGTTTAGSLGHVVYVEAVNGDGTVTISEMNYSGWGKTNTRTVSAGSFVYIY